MTPSDMRDIMKLSGKNADNMSPTMIENEVDKMVTANPTEFNRIVNLSGFKTRVLIEDLININAIRMNGANYLVGEIVIGHDNESAVLYLDDQRHNSMLISLKNQLELKTQPA